jgi:hypothetical protein
MKDLMQQFDAIKKEQFDSAVRANTLVGNLTNWRELKNNTVKSKILKGHSKLLSFLSRG